MARKKLFVDGDIANTIHQVWDLYTTSQTAKGVSDITLRNYKQHLHSISKYLDVERSIDDLTKSDLELEKLLVFLHRLIIIQKENMIVL